MNWNLIGIAGPVSNLELVGRLLMAAALGSVIGIERERLQWAAGLRTHMLVCVGSALIMIVSTYGFTQVQGKEGVVLDPSRVAAQVVSGIGFLGAGSILLRGEVIRGLTTAASLWTVAGVGLAVGGGLYVASSAATAIILVILVGVKPLERRFIAAKLRREVRLVASRGALSIDTLSEVLGPGSERIKRFIVQQQEDGGDIDEVTIAFSRVTDPEFATIVRRLKQMQGVHHVREVVPS
ncbi:MULTISPECIES: MgtC/SapB family protein [Burkholderiaceae]|uniref:MgtC/SapB family protein n=1 Tax=Burkholderiaceae TaxID=119060 RepID=UPI00096331D9|nr:MULTISPECIES: MgtC/SapB family protein [Burkholderiaceae]MCG1019353.1 MgtC/SapB family protein [Mycetohabitans sp. B4]SIT78696.1 putative Mg2+ transporter-C (MgtC) family protein [Burkholderia sp. b13]